MSRVLVDSSVWISFFKGREEAKTLLNLIDANQICVSDLILAELLPALLHRRESHLVDVLRQVERVPISIDWDWIIEVQRQNLANGINKVGIPDLMIARTAIENEIPLYSFDKHFQLMATNNNLHLYNV